MDAGSIYDEVFDSDMEYPEGMTDDQARSVWHAYERRFLAEEMDYQVANGYPWAEKARKAVERGETTWNDIFEEAWGNYYNEDKNYEMYFAAAAHDWMWRD